MKKIIIALAALTMTQVATARDVSPLTKIVKIYTYKDAAVVKIENPSTNTYGCTYGNAGEYLAIRFNNTQGREMYSAILSAYMTDTRISLISAHCDNVWGSSKSMNKVYRVDLER